MFANSGFSGKGFVMIAMEERWTGVTCIFFAFMTVIKLVVENDARNIALLEFFCDKTYHVVFRFNLVWEILFFVDEAERKEDTLLELEELGLMTEVFVQFIE